MSWVSTMGRKFIAAYSEGLVMTCPMHRAEVFFNAGDQATGHAPGAIDKSQDNVRAALRPEYAGVFTAQAGSSVRH